MILIEGYVANATSATGSREKIKLGSESAIIIRQASLVSYSVSHLVCLYVYPRATWCVCLFTHE